MKCYAIKDKQIFDLDKLYLALLVDGTVQQLLVTPSLTQSTNKAGNIFSRTEGRSHCSCLI